MTLVTTAPVLLTRQHDLSRFRSGVDELDSWLRQRALRNQDSSSSRTYVALIGDEVVGYYALAPGSARLSDVPGPVRRNAPDPVPLLILGRLAIDESRQGTGLGSALLRDAVLRCRTVIDIVSARALLVHAISDAARRFYLGRGFLASPNDPMTLLLPEKAMRP